jgi:hypothetical protein
LRIECSHLGGRDQITGDDEEDIDADKPPGARLMPK